MKYFYWMILLAIVGVGIGIAAIVYGNRPPQTQTKPMIAFQPPFSSFIAGTGIVEAGSRNIPVGTPVSGIVTNIYVTVGERVKKGTPLFQIDDRTLQAALLTAKAKVKETETARLEPLHQFEIAGKLKKLNPHAISKSVYSKRADALAEANARIALAKAKVVQLQKEIARHTVRAPINGEILQCRIMEGAYADNSATSALLLLGETEHLHLRIEIDEYDAWRMHPGAKAVAFVRGHPDMKIPLTYAYTEPYIIPKTTLTGISTERTDTRVLQVIYRFHSGDFPLFVGQQLDVFIQAPQTHAGKPGR